MPVPCFGHGDSHHESQDSAHQFVSMSAASDNLAKLTTVNSDIDTIVCQLSQIDDHMERDEQRMFFLLNTNIAREDFYEIRSVKNGEVRSIVINCHAEVIFDSENKVKAATDGQVPAFDEIDEQFLHVIADDHAGRDYFRRLRGLQHLPKIPQDLPRDVRHHRKREQEEVAREDGRQLRQTIVDNFRQQDLVERQCEIDKILLRKEENEQQQEDLLRKKEARQHTLLHLEKHIADMQVKREQEVQESNEANRKSEHDSKRLAWLDRFAPQTRSPPAPMDIDSTPFSKDGIYQSEASTSCDESGLKINNDDEVLSLGSFTEGA